MRTLCFFFFSLMIAPAVMAQALPADGSSNVDSFFDVFTEISLGDPKCDPCEALRQEIRETEQEIAEVEAEIAGYDLVLPFADSFIASAESSLKDLEAQLQEMQNPKNYVESDGRRYDSSDHAALQRYHQNLWKAYKGGRMTAEEYSDDIAKPFDDPEVADALKMLKEIIENELKDKIADAKKNLEELKKARDEYQKKKEDAERRLDELKAKLAKLQEQLEDCLKRCPKEEVHIPEDYGIGQDEKSIMDALRDFFDGIFGDEPEGDDPFAGLDDFLDGLDGGAGDIPTEMQPLDLRSTPPIDSFFDVFVDMPLPPVVCHLCDPLRAQLEEIEQSLSDLLQQQAEAQAEVDAAYNDLATANAAKSATEQVLDRLNNPRDYVESEGRRMDSSDQAAMRARNERLWNEYRNGDRSARDLENEWKKPFDDPEVQRELDAIKQRMKDELQDAINDAQEAIDRLNDRITEINDQLVNLAGTIAAHRAVIEYLLRDLAECEKRCRERADEPMDLVLPGFEGFLFPDNFEGLLEGGDGTGAGGSDDEQRDDEGDDNDEGDDREDEEEEPKEVVGILCNWFGLFCPKKEEVRDLTIGYAIDCFEGKMDASLCAPFDSNQDGTVNAMDLSDWNLSLTGPSEVNIPLTINGMDGNDMLTLNDLHLFGGCLNGGPCDGLNFTPSPLLGGDVPFDSFPGLNGGDFGLVWNPGDGNDVLLGDPVPDPFVGMDGIPNIDPNGPFPPFPNDFFGPGSNFFAGGPPTFFGPGGQDIFPTNPPPLPTATSESEIVQELVRQALSRLPKLKECEKYVVTVTRQRIGTTTRYTIRVVKTYSCMPEEDQGCQSDADCDDGDECTQDSCNHNGECVSTQIEGCGDDLVAEECPELSYGEGKAAESACREVCQGTCTQIAVGPTERLCWMCSDPTVESRTCEMIGYFTKREDCQRTCNGTCIGGEKDNRNCYECVPAKASQTCDAPTMEVRLCEEACEEPEKGRCEKSYTRKDGVSCYSCKTATQVREECPSGSSANCSSTCDGTCETVKTLNDGTKCERCVITQTTPQCPSGHAKNASDCPSGATAIPDESGCYECAVVNCPGGTFKNECPSSCASGCDIAAEQHNVKCYRCKQSCEDLCIGQNYARVGMDWSDHIQSYLNGFSCVSGASISLQTATVSGCTCSNQPTVTIDQTVPVCRGTPCGDVACGQSASCPVGENTTATVTCKWGGWKKIDMNKFQPVVGQ